MNGVIPPRTIYFHEVGGGLYLLHFNKVKAALQRTQVGCVWTLRRTAASFFSFKAERKSRIRANSERSWKRILFTSYL